jgi:hypothetical protein
MGALFPSPMAAFLLGKEVTMWMMSCGSVVMNPASFAQLAAEVQRQVHGFLIEAQLTPSPS